VIPSARTTTARVVHTPSLVIPSAQTTITTYFEFMQHRLVLE
jgi:hypothetical protein